MIYRVGITKGAMKGNEKSREKALEYGKKLYPHAKILYTSVFNLKGHEDIQQHEIGNSL